MFGDSLQSQLNKLKSENKKLREHISDKEIVDRHAKRQQELDTAEAVNEVKREMQGSLVRSDIRRAEALARADVLDNHNDTLKKIVDKLIEKVGPKQDIKVIK